MSRAAAGGGVSLSKQELAALQESAQARAEEGIKFLQAKLQEATNRGAVKGSGAKSGGGTASLSSAPSLGGGGTNTNGVATVTTARFFRVAKVAAGFIDGWGSVAGEFPEGTNFVAVAAGWYDSGTHHLALRADGTVVAWGNTSTARRMFPLD